jgi:hypothetical protein
MAKGPHHTATIIAAFLADNLNHFQRILRISSAVLLVGLIGLFAYAVDEYYPATTNAPSPVPSSASVPKSGSLSDPDTLFKEQPQFIPTLTIGCRHEWIDGDLASSLDEGQHVPFLKIMGQDKGPYGMPISLFMIRKTIYADLTVYSPNTGTGFVLRGNNFTITNPDWDENHNDWAIEVTNEEGTPIFQLIRESRSSLRINGLFELFNVTLAYTPTQFGRDTYNGQFVPGTYVPPNDFLLPMFKHPGRRYPGQLTDNPDPASQYPENTKCHVG